jgi:uncharacterized protein YndB with AHSA1/START domain
MTTDAVTRFVYATFIRTTPERLWSALTDPEFMKQYWFGAAAQCDWKAGSPWQLVLDDGKLADLGEVVAVEPLKRIQLKWQNQWNPEFKAEGFSRCTIELEPLQDAVKLSITHEMDVPESKFIGAVSGGWPRILSNLKSLLETGEVVLRK